MIMPATIPSTTRNTHRKILRMCWKLLRVLSAPSSCDSRFEHHFNHPDRVAMNFDRVVDIFAVAARHDSYVRNLTFVTLAQHALVALTKAVKRKAEAAKLITGIRISSGEIENDFRIVSKNSRQMIRKTLEVFVVGCAVG